MKYAYFRQAASAATKQWLDTASPYGDNEQDIDVLIDLLEQEVFRTVSASKALVELLRKEQQPDESVDSLRMFINEKARYCFHNIDNLKDHVLKTAFIKALTSSETRRKLYAAKNLDYAECVEFARNEEKAAKDDEAISRGGSSSVSALGQRVPGSNRGFHKTQRGYSSRGGRGCHHKEGSKPQGKAQGGNCGFTHAKNKCFTDGKNCLNCGQIGYLARCCRSASWKGSWPLAEREANSIQGQVGTMEAMVFSCQVEPTKGRPDQNKATCRCRGVRTGCGWCAGPQRHKKSHCPAKGKECYQCNEMGHFARACRNRRRILGPQNRDERRKLLLNEVRGNELKNLFAKRPIEEAKVTRGPRKSYAKAVKQTSPPNLKKKTTVIHGEKQNQILEWRKDLPILEPGQPVFIRNPHSKRWDGEGIILGFGQNSREYIVEFNRNKKRFIRNRVLLKPKLLRKKVGMYGGGKLRQELCLTKEARGEAYQSSKENYPCQESLMKIRVKR